MVEAVSIHAVTVFEVADDRLDGRAALHLPFDGRRDPSLLFGREDAQFIDAGRIVASVTGVGEDAFQGGAGQLLDLGDYGLKGVTVVGPPRQGLGMDGKLSTFAAIERGGYGDLDAELIRFVDLAFTVSVRSGRGMGPVKRISHVEARPHKALSFCW